MKCPRCRATLSEVDLGQFGGEYAAVVIDLCPACEGVWLDKGELDKRDESVWTDAEALDFDVVAQRAELSCPKCAVAMTAISPREAPGLQLERCPECLGFWLDGGETEAVQALAAGADAATQQRMTALARPPGWSWLRWALHCLREYYSRRV